MCLDLSGFFPNPGIRPRFEIESHWLHCWMIYPSNIQYYQCLGCLLRVRSWKYCVQREVLLFPECDVPVRDSGEERSVGDSSVVCHTLLLFSCFRPGSEVTYIASPQWSFVLMSGHRDAATCPLLISPTIPPRWVPIGTGPCLSAHWVPGAPPYPISDHLVLTFGISPELNILE